MHIYMYVCMFVCMYLYIYVYYIYVRVCKCVCLCMYFRNRTITTRRYCNESFPLFSGAYLRIIAIAGWETSVLVDNYIDKKINNFLLLASSILYYNILLYTIQIEN